MKSSEIRELSISDLQEKLADEQNAMATLRFNHSISSLENPMQIRNRRRNIARIKTELVARNKKA